MKFNNLIRNGKPLRAATSAGDADKQLHSVAERSRNYRLDFFTKKLHVIWSSKK